MVHQRRNVLPAVAQRRQFDTEDVEAVEKVRTELTLFNQFFQILVGGGDASEVHFNGLVATDASEFALLQNPQ